VTLAEDFYRPWEGDTITSFQAIDDLLTRLSERWLDQRRQFAWRGVADASYPLHSSLYRRLHWQRLKDGITEPPNEADLASSEGDLLANAHRWGLHNGPHGRLSLLNQLATLQHFGAPTRLVDVTLNAYIGLWFAVEKHDDRDGRLFAVDISSRLINEQDELRGWEDRMDRPWSDFDESRWTGETFAWIPSPFERRVAAQNGAFLFAGVPRTRSGFQVPRTPRSSRTWPVAQIREVTSLPMRFHLANPRAGGVRAQGAPTYTFRIAATAKENIRRRLAAQFGYSHRTIYPDFPGFAAFGTDLPGSP
jgi:hypothetical protein